MTSANNRHRNHHHIKMNSAENILNNYPFKMYVRQ